jgi:hypothetical protein
MVALDYGRSGANVTGIIVASALLKTALPGTPTVGTDEAARLVCSPAARSRRAIAEFVREKTQAGR